MTDSRTCSRCGAPLPQGHDASQPCPRCLLRVGMDVSSITSSAQRVPAPSIAELQPHFDKLELLELIGEGGMGAVYKARHKELDRIVAVKVLTVRDEQSAAFDERFAREARAMATLTHPHIAAVYDFGKLGGWSFLILEYVEGQNLRQVLRSRVVEPRDALRWVAQICEALQYAHEHGVVHRDIKPENILIDATGNAKVVDFGLAKLLVKKPGEATLTGTQQSMGTWHYMAPEQYERPASVDHRADIFSLGVVFYELLTGKLPVGAFAPPSQKLQIDVRVDEVVLKALAREPEQRYQHASDVKSDVESLGTAPQRAAVHAGDHGWSTGKWVAAILATIVGIPLALGCVFAMWVLPMNTGSIAESPGAHAQSASSAFGIFQSLLILGVISVLAALVAVLFVRRRRDRAPSVSNSAARDSVPHDHNNATAWIAAAVAALIAFLGLGMLTSLIALALAPRFEVHWGDNWMYGPVIFGVAMQALRLAGAVLIGLFAWRIVARRHAEPIAASSAPAPVAAAAPRARRGAWILVAVIVAIGLTAIAGCIGSVLLYGMAGREGPPAPTMVTPAVPDHSADPTRDR